MTHRSCQPVSHWYPIEVLHFPIRTAEQAEQKYLTWSQVFGDQAMGTHRRPRCSSSRVGSWSTSRRTVSRMTWYVEVSSRVCSSSTRRLRDVLRALSRAERGRRGFTLPSERDTPMDARSSDPRGYGLGDERSPVCSGRDGPASHAASRPARAPSRLLGERSPLKLVQTLWCATRLTSSTPRSRTT